ncbi:MAG: hypothetical protein JJU20_04160, partial [Opitutales bacterium]|nr:hypothetical protein [Opitutales bacterium]
PEGRAPTYQYSTNPTFHQSVNPTPNIQIIIRWFGWMDKGIHPPGCLMDFSENCNLCNYSVVFDKWG